MGDVAVTRERATPKESGSYARSTACAVVCDNIARKLSVRARVVALEAGRPDLRYARLARLARELANSFRAWTEPPPRGRTNVDDRGIDLAAYDLLIQRARALGIEPIGP